jgi:hypothetical protein
MLISRVYWLIFNVCRTTSQSPYFSWRRNVMLCSLPGRAMKPPVSVSIRRGSSRLIRRRGTIPDCDSHPVSRPDGPDQCNGTTPRFAVLDVVTSVAQDQSELRSRNTDRRAGPGAPCRHLRAQCRPRIQWQRQMTQLHCDIMEGNFVLVASLVIQAARRSIHKRDCPMHTSESPRWGRTGASCVRLAAGCMMRFRGSSR